MDGKLEAIWRKRAHGGPMDPLPRVRLVAGGGVEGSADQGGTRQVTLIEREVFQAVSRELGRDVDPATRRANLLVSGLPLTESSDRTLAVGPCRIRIRGETRPCNLMEEQVAGLRGALASPSWRGGAYGEVVTGGEISVGDAVSWVEESGTAVEGERT
jgi:MOSC domain-containing protein YiiM